MWGVDKNLILMRNWFFVTKSFLGREFFDICTFLYYYFKSITRFLLFVTYQKLCEFQKNQIPSRFTIYRHEICWCLLESWFRWLKHMSYVKLSICCMLIRHFTKENITVTTRSTEMYVDQTKRNQWRYKTSEFLNPNVQINLFITFHCFSNILN